MQAKIEKDRIFEGMDRISNIINARLAKKKFSLTKNEKVKSMKFDFFF